LPWIIMYLPICLWTFYCSGSPFGPMLQGRFGEGIYNVSEINATIARTGIANRISVGEMLKFALLDYSFLIWFFLGLLFISRKVLIARTVTGAALLLQIGLIVAALPWDIRFLSGVPRAAAILGCLYGPRSILRSFAAFTVRWKLGLAMATVPWLIAELFYVAPFARHLIDPNLSSYYKNYTALYDDYVVLDKLLPSNAVVLVSGIRMNSIYSPRPVVFHIADLPTGKPVYLLCSSNPANPPVKVLKEQYVIREQVYENPHALTFVSRVPGVPAGHRHVYVYSLVKKPD
jgi:hypothetical protein